MNRFSLLFLGLASFAGAWGQLPSLEQTGSIYFAYPEVTTPPPSAPQGYEPFYISHYGRHGSRWLPSAESYTSVLNELERLDSLDALTALGRDVLSRSRQVWEDAKGNAGMLTPLGVEQHRGIASRMAGSFPQLFEPGDSVFAASSTVRRCQQSMEAFLGQLQTLSPSLKVGHETSEATMAVIAPREGEAAPFFADSALWQRQLWLDGLEKTSRRLIPTLVKDTSLMELSPRALTKQLYWFASDMQNVPLQTEVSFYDIFLPEELQEIWQTQNAKMQTICGMSPRNSGFPQHNAYATLEDIIQRADGVIDAKQGEGNVVDLRFGHDSHLLRLLSLMGVVEASANVADLTRTSDLWRDYRLSPMAANLQMVFFRPENSTADEPVIVCLLLNEQPVHLPLTPVSRHFYSWPLVREYLTAKLPDQHQFCH